MQPDQIPIINYHKIENGFDVGITARHPMDFEEDMQLLVDAGFTSITFNEILSGQIPENPVIITFDDGYASVFEKAWPVMNKFGLKGVCFTPLDFIGRCNDWDVQIGNLRFQHLDREQMRYLAGNGFEMGSHCLSHRALTDIELSRAEHEIVTSREKLAEICGHEVTTICYPFGCFNDSIIEMTRRAGYSFGLASLHFRNVSDGERNFALRRYNIYRFDSSRTIRQKLENNYDSYLGWRDWLIQKGARATVLYQKFFKKNNSGGKSA